MARKASKAMVTGDKLPTRKSASKAQRKVAGQPRAVTQQAWDTTHRVPNRPVA